QGIAAFLGDEAAREFDDVAPHHRRHQGAGVERLGEKGEPAQGVIHAREILFEVAADLGRGAQARQDIDEAKQRRAQRLVFERPVDHSAEQIFGLEQRGLVRGGFLIKRARQPLHFRLDGFDGGIFAGHRKTGCQLFVIFPVIIIRSPAGKKRAGFLHRGLFRSNRRISGGDFMASADKSTAETLSGAEAAVEMLCAHGVKFLFGLCGDTSLPFYDALARLAHGLHHILARDERSAAYMADGYARVCGKVGVCEGPSGGGVTYILPGLAEANESSVPLLCINSDISVAARGRYTLTELDQSALMRPVTKWNLRLDRAEDLPAAFRAAFQQITTGRPGAAHIALPFDVQNGRVQRAGVWGDPRFGASPAERTEPDGASVERAARLLRQAARPVFI